MTTLTAFLTGQAVGAGLLWIGVITPRRRQKTVVNHGRNPQRDVTEISDRLATEKSPTPSRPVQHESAAGLFTHTPRPVNVTRDDHPLYTHHEPRNYVDLDPERTTIIRPAMTGPGMAGPPRADIVFRAAAK